ncbi:MAG: hypothetical protein HUJ61_03755 [Bacilli bacterium]|nr:hypothetical protein [Bacilli bacterium]
MISSIAIAIITIVSLILSILFFPKIKIKNIELGTYWIVSFIGALLMIVFKCISFNQIFEFLTSSSAVNPLKILILFFSMTLLSIFLDELGFFRYLASKASNIAKSSQYKLFFILYILVSFLTIFTSNDVVILTFTPFICYFCKNAKINPIPYLVSEFAAANTWSMMFIIGNPTNIYLGTSMGVDFISYFKIMWLPTLMGGIFESLILFLLFRKSLNEPIEFQAEKEHIENIPNLVIGLLCLGTCLVLLVISSLIELQMWFISFICALSLLILLTFSNLIQKRHFTNIINSLKRLPYELIPFLLSMFIIVSSLSNQGVCEYISSFIGENLIITKYGLTSYISCNLINNIPMSILYASLPNSSNPLLNLKATYASIIGSNLGAFLTPIGALAGIMFTSLLKKYEINDYTYAKFIIYGVVISIPTLFMTLFGLFIVL